MFHAPLHALAVELTPIVPEHMCVRRLTNANSGDKCHGWAGPRPYNGWTTSKSDEPHSGVKAVVGYFGERDTGVRVVALGVPHSTPFSGQFWRQCMQFGKSAGNFGGLAFRWLLRHDSACRPSKLVALLSNFMQIVYIWSEKGIVPSANERYPFLSGQQLSIDHDERSLLPPIRLCQSRDGDS